MTVQYHKKNSLLGINLSAAAAKHILSYLHKNRECTGVRFSVKKTGCSGLSYVVDYVLIAQANDLVQPLAKGYQIYIDQNSYRYLQGMTVDYIKQGLNCKFMFSNPNQTGQCGCGESFTVSSLK